LGIARRDCPLLGLLLLEWTLPLSPAVIAQFVAIDVAICGLLLADFFLRVYLSEDRGWYISTHWTDLVASILYTGVFQWGRLLRVARVTPPARLSLDEHAVMPSSLGRYYLYNRAPMTLATMQPWRCTRPSWLKRRLAPIHHQRKMGGMGYNSRTHP
jgi:hypothetical protein